MADLFDAESDRLRRRLAELGWISVRLFGGPAWQNPVSGVTLPEKVALEELARAEPEDDLPEEPE